MNKFLQFFSIIVLSSLLFSCSQSSDVISSNTIQKRKYNKGFFADFGKKKNKLSSKEVKSEKSEVVVVEEKYNEATIDNMALVSEVDNEVKILSKTKKLSPENNLIEEKEEKQIPTPNLMEMNTNTYYNFSVEEDGSEPKYGFLGTLLLVILALFLPALAVLIYEGATSRFWIILILNLVGIGLLGGGIYFGGLLSLIATIWAILIVVGAV